MIRVSEPKRVPQLIDILKIAGPLLNQNVPPSKKQEQRGLRHISYWGSGSKDLPRDGKKSCKILSGHPEAVLRQSAFGKPSPHLLFDHVSKSGEGCSRPNITSSCIQPCPILWSVEKNFSRITHSPYPDILLPSIQGEQFYPHPSFSSLDSCKLILYVDHTPKMLPRNLFSILMYLSFDFSPWKIFLILRHFLST